MSQWELPCCAVELHSTLDTDSLTDGYCACPEWCRGGGGEGPAVTHLHCSLAEVKAQDLKSRLLPPLLHSLFLLLGDRTL